MVGRGRSCIMCMCGMTFCVYGGGGFGCLCVVVVWSIMCQVETFLALWFHSLDVCCFCGGLLKCAVTLQGASGMYQM